MLKKAAIYLTIAASIALIGFQIYTMYNMIFSIKATSVDEEDVVIRQGKDDDDRIAFTCNVDWGEEIMPGMLEVFKQKQLKITFFISGKWAENNPKLLRKIYLDGHEIQNHGYRHRLCSQISDSEVRDEMKKTEEAILKYTGLKTNIFAPPAGDYDSKTVEICKEENYILSLWSIDTIDWRAGSTSEIIKRRVLKKKLNGGIVLMHPKEETVKALPSIIEEIQKRGISIVTLSELCQI